MWRADFPILEQRVHGRPLVYLDNAATTQKPRAVLAVLHDFYTQTNSNVHRGDHYLSQQADTAYAQARETVRGFINARDASEIVFTQSTTDAINLVAASFGESLTPGDEIVITGMEHHSNIVPWQMACERKGAALKVIPLRPDGALMLDELPKLLNARTRLIAVTHVSNVTGVVNPVKDIIGQAGGIPVLIDGAQAVQHLPVDVQDLGCAFYVFSGHKMYAPAGVGVLYGQQRLLERMPPYQFGGGMIVRVRMSGTEFVDPPLRFEAGTRNVAGAISLAAAIEYVERQGLDAIAEYESDVYESALARLRELGVTIYGRGRCGALSFNAPGAHHHDVGMILDKLGVAVRTGRLCADPLMDHFGVEGVVRASFGLYNTREDVNALVEGVERARGMLQ